MFNEAIQKIKVARFYESRCIVPSFEKKFE